jgi:hypothetical protein
MRKYYVESSRRGISYIRGKEGRLIGHMLHRNCLQNHIIEGQIEGGIEIAGR